jgi:hypothetical protein
LSSNPLIAFIVLNKKKLKENFNSDETTNGEFNPSNPSFQLTSPDENKTLKGVKKGLPDFSWHNTPKRGKLYQNDH